MSTNTPTNGADTLFGGAGSDTIDGLAGNDRIYGRGGADELYGFLGRDSLYGGSGNDLIRGEDGLDKVYGGGGDDAFLIAGGDLVAGEIYDGGTGIDTLDQAGYSTGIYDYRGITLAGLEYFDVRNGEALTIHFEAAHFAAGNFMGQMAGLAFGTSNDMKTFEVFIHMGGLRVLDLRDLNVEVNLEGDATGTFTILGTGAADRIIAPGSDGDWIAFGGGGADIINMNSVGGAFGGGGHDVIRNIGVDATASGQAGRDTIILTSKYSVASGGAGSDRILMRGNQDTAFGDGGADTLVLLGSDNQANGGAGNDIFDVRTLTGPLDGGDGHDILDLSGFNLFGFAGIQISGFNGTFSGLDGLTLSEAAVISGFEEVIATDSADRLFAGAGITIYRAGGGNDTFSSSGTGAETVFGGTGADTLRLNTSGDALFGGRGSDSLTANGAFFDGGGVFNGGKGEDYISFTTRPSTFGAYTYDMRDTVLRSIENFEFAGIVGGGSGKVILNAQQFGTGLALDATIDMNGTTQTRTLDVHMNGRAALDLSDLTFVEDSAFHELQIYGGTPGEMITGGTLVRNDIRAGAGADTLTGGQRSDVLQGGAGCDVLSGRGANDWIEGGMGQDTMTGGGGSDSFIFRSAGESRTGGARRDVITDFNVNRDEISVLTFAEDFIGSAAFSGSAGEIRAVVTANGLHTRILIDEDGDSLADFELFLRGVTGFTEANLDAPA